MTDGPILATEPFTIFVETGSAPNSVPYDPIPAPPPHPPGSPPSNPPPPPPPFAR